jgi:hypothetical protein
VGFWDCVGLPNVAMSLKMSNKKKRPIQRQKTRLKNYHHRILNHFFWHQTLIFHYGLRNYSNSNFSKKTKVFSSFDKNGQK